MTGFAPEVQKGLVLALEAERRGFITIEKLNELLAYYDKDGQLYPAPAREVLQRLGGVTTDQLRELLGLGPAGFQPRELTPRLLLLEPLGEGGMGTVYKAQDRILRRVVAVKLIRKDRLASQQALQRFEREAMVMARVAHPACIPVYDANVVDGQPYLVMKYAPGSSLRTELAKHPGQTDPRRVARWGQRLAEGLQACHEVGVVHRDVKPGNILLDEQDQPLLTDFGVALDGEAATKLTLGSNPVGTLAYMPPEQALGEPADPRSDIYSLGATLYEALAGAPPFATDQPLLLFRMIAEDEPRPLRSIRSGVAEDLERVVLKCLEKRRDDRYPTAQALALDLARWLAGETVSARPISLVHKLVRSASRNRRLFVATAGGLLLLGTGLMTWSAAHARVSRQRARAAIEAATLGSDRATGELQLVRLAADRDPQIAGPAAAALREHRAVSRLVEADRQFRHWEELIARELAVKLRLNELEREDALLPVEASAAKQERLQLERESARLPVLQQEALSLVERELAAAELIGTAEVRIERQRARLLAALARRSVERDPEVAEELYSRAIDADRRGGNEIASSLRPARLLVQGGPPARFQLWRYAYSESAGRPLPRPVAQGFPPAALEVPSGEYLLEVWTPGALPIRDTLLLLRGEFRASRLVPVARSSLGPLVDEIVTVPAGGLRVGRSLAVTREQLEHDVLIARHEVTLEAWRGMWIESGKPESLLPKGLTDPVGMLSGRRAVTLPFSGASVSRARAWCQWLSLDIALAGISGSARLPTLRECRRAARGEFAWLYPWGREFDATFVATADLKRGSLAQVDECAIDTSPFGVRSMAGSLAELTSESSVADTVAFFGGSVVDSAPVLREWLLTGGGIPTEAQDFAIGFRYVLTKAEVATVPLPDPTADWRARALERARAGDWKEALPAARNHIALAPKDPQRWLERYALRLLAGDTWGARFDAIQATLLAPKMAQAWVVLSYVEFERGQHDRVIEACTRGLELEPGRRVLLWRRAQSSTALGRFREAIADAETWRTMARTDADRIAVENLLFVIRSRQAIAIAAEALRRQ